jgi:hypothetical protein
VKSRERPGERIRLERLSMNVPRQDYKGKCTYMEWKGKQFWQERLDI